MPELDNDSADGRRGTGEAPTITLRFEGQSPAKASAAAQDLRDRLRTSGLVQDVKFRRENPDALSLGDSLIITLQVGMTGTQLALLLYQFSREQRLVIEVFHRDPKKGLVNVRLRGDKPEDRSLLRKFIDALIRSVPSVDEQG